MNKKSGAFIGLFLILYGILQLFVNYIDSSILNFIFTYQVIIILFGIFIILQNPKKKLSGVLMIVLGVYLYLEDYLPNKYQDLIFPLILIVLGIVILYKYLVEKK
ncbi:LiaF transmembrane domain-containing protein [Oceanivirga miroungae]|uniref:LiaF transmembrane domain-containing protein n=1 Tax=Oceanivirga miroungae TaxID=1130046 RepID=A0A6I8MAT5_9FUSO|nr:hypothetical protein [Oceanivirga miroungae]VWL85293.1 hypothetical protein OMES3154_00576 [Oceanivirga miroungae]